MITLVLFARGRTESTYQFSDDVVTIGRHPDSSIKLLHASIAKHHARLTRQEGRWMLENLGPRGTVLRGRTIQAPAEVTIGDSFRLGDTWSILVKAIDGVEGPDRATLRLVDSQSGSCLTVEGLRARVCVDGPVATTNLQVWFTNQLDAAVEGDLVFPLPPFAAIRSLEVKVGDRRIEGQIRARQGAKEDYQRAVEAGQTAALAESEGEDLARLRVAPIGAGEKVHAEVTTVHTLLPIADGHRLVIPLTYMPRYVENPAALSDVSLAAVDRPRPLSLEARADVEIRVAHPDGLPKPLRCASHRTATEAGEMATVVRVASCPLDRDLQLEIADFPTTGSPGVWIRHDPSDSADGLGPATAAVVLPPAFADEQPTVPRSVTVLVDRSGSMQRGPMQAAIRAVRGFLRSLGPGDVFNVVAFDDRLEALAPGHVPFSQANLAAADHFVGSLFARESTEASAALAAVLGKTLVAQRFELPEAPPPDGKPRLRLVVFMTDGDVEGASEVLSSVKSSLVDTRLHVLGIGDCVNHAMLAQLATLGGGRYFPVSTEEDLERALVRLKASVNGPVWTGLRFLLEQGGVRKAPDLFEPEGVLDLFAGEPLLVAWRGALAAGARLIVEGRNAQSDDTRIVVPVRPADDERGSIASTVWALLRNRRLTYRFDPDDEATLERLAIHHGIANRAAALVGIHPDSREEQAHGSVPVSLPMPRNIDETVDYLLASPSILQGGGVSAAPPPPEMEPIQPAAPSAGSGQPTPALCLMSRCSQDLGTLIDTSPQEARTYAKAARAPLTDNESGLRALLLEQTADGLFEGGIGVTLAAVAALVSRGHTAREGLFRAELRRTLAALQAGEWPSASTERTWAELAIAMLTMPHGAEPPVGLSQELSEALAGAAILNLLDLRARIRRALLSAPAGWDSTSLGSELRAVFFR